MKTSDILIIEKAIKNRDGFIIGGKEFAYSEHYQEYLCEGEGFSALQTAMCLGAELYKNKEIIIVKEDMS